jgi:teichuronic acid biosynthesis protein TuaE
VLKRSNFEIKCISHRSLMVLCTTLILFMLAFVLLLPYSVNYSLIVLGIAFCIPIIMFFPDLLAPLAILQTAVLYLDNLTMSPIVNIQKIFVLVSIIIYIVMYGIKKKITYIPIWTYLLLLVFSLTLSTWPQGFTMNDLITGFAGYLLGWVIFYTNWRSVDKYLKLLTYMSAISLAIGLLFTIAHIHNVIGIDYLGNMRIEGSTISPYLAMMGLIGMVAAITIYHRPNQDKKSLYVFMILFNFLIVLATLTRGAIIGALLILVAFVINYVRNFRKNHGYISFGILSGFIFLLLVTLVFTYYAASRTFMGTSGDDINSSGRMAAWAEYLKLSSVNRIFGLGIGSLKTLKGTDLVGTTFTAAHNEYIHFIVENGVVGFALILLSFIVIFAVIWRNNNLGRAGYLFPCLIMTFVIFSFTDNTIAAPQFWYLFCWYLGLIYNKREVENKISRKFDFTKLRK